MVPVFQKLTSQLSEKFHKEPPQKLFHQDPPKWNLKIKTTFAALTAFSTFGGAGYLLYRNSFSKIHLSNSISSPINTAFKVIGSLSALTGLGLLAYFSSSKTPVKNSEEKNEIIPLKFSNDNSQKPKEPYITKILSSIYKEEKIDKDILTEEIDNYIEISTNSPDKTLSNENFISEIANLIKTYQNFLLYKWINLENKKSNLCKILDILDVFNDRTDPLSHLLIENIFSNILPNGLYEMTKDLIGLKDEESRDLVNRSVQLVLTALNQQMTILFSDVTDFEIQQKVKKAFIRILELLTPFEKDDFRLDSNFYEIFVQQSSPQLIWKFVHEYIFNYIISNKLPNNLDLFPEKIIGNFLNSRVNDYNSEEDTQYIDEVGLIILKIIVAGARLSLFLDDQDQGAASFAIRVIQHKHKIDSQKFENDYPNDNENLKELYFKLCPKKDLAEFKDFAKEKNLSDQATLIAEELIKERSTASLANYLLNANLALYSQEFMNKINSLTKTDLLQEEIGDLQVLSLFIVSQILDSSIPKRAGIATKALDTYTEVLKLVDMEAVNQIKETYLKIQSTEDIDLNSACQRFLKACETLPEFNPEIKTRPKDLELADEELPAEQKEIENSKI